MQRRNNKDYLEKLINHTMQHGKKIAAIKLVAKSVSVFVQKLVRQGIISNSISLRRVTNRPRLSSTLFNHLQVGNNKLFSSAFDRLKVLENLSPSVTNQRMVTPRAVLDGVIETNSLAVNLPTLFFSITASTTQSTPFEKVEDWSLDSTQNFVEIGASKGINIKNENMTFRKEKTKVARRSVEKFVKDAISHVQPSLETRKKKIAGITRHIPSVVHPSRGERLAIRWLIAAAREKQKREGKGFAQCLSNQLLDAYLKKGEPRQKRESLHKLAENNRSYIRFRWW